MFVRIFERYVTKFAPHKALKSIPCGKLTFDERVVIHRVAPLDRRVGGAGRGRDALSAFSSSVTVMLSQLVHARLQRCSLSSLQRCSLSSLQRCSLSLNPGPWTLLAVARCTHVRFYTRKVRSLVTSLGRRVGCAGRGRDGACGTPHTLNPGP